MTKRSDCRTLKLTRQVAVTRWSRVRYWSVTPSTWSSGGTIDGSLTAGRSVDLGEEQVLPRCGTVLDGADAVHEVGILHDVFGRGREFDVRIVEDIDDLFDGETSCGERARPRISCLPQSCWLASSMALRTAA